MTLEAFVNEVSGDVIPEQDRAAFDRGREPYKKAQWPILGIVQTFQIGRN